MRMISCHPKKSLDNGINFVLAKSVFSEVIDTTVIKDDFFFFFLV